MCEKPVAMGDAADVERVVFKHKVSRAASRTRTRTRCPGRLTSTESFPRDPDADPVNGRLCRRAGLYRGPVYRLSNRRLLPGAAGPGQSDGPQDQAARAGSV